MDTEQQFATYCTYVLGLRKTTTSNSRSTKTTLPYGSDVAFRLAPNLLAQRWY